MDTLSNTVTSERARHIVVGVALFLALSLATASFFIPIRADDLPTYIPSSNHFIGQDKYFDLMASVAPSACVPSSNYWESVPSLEHALSKHSGLYWNDQIYVIGGLPGTETAPRPTNDVWRAEIGTDGLATAWEVTNSTGLPTFSRAAAVVNDGYIYVVGGHDGQVITGTTYFAQIEVGSDGNTTNWSRSPYLITLGRDYHQAVVFRDRLYVLGGYTRNGEVDEIQVASIGSNGNIGAWQELNGGLKEPLAGFTAVMYRDWLYILGGVHGRVVTDSVYFARLENDFINKVYTDTTPLPVSMYLLTAFVLQDRIFVVGGRAYDQGIAHSCAGIWSAEINPANGTLGSWEQEHTLPLALESHATILVNDGNHVGQVYVIGGEEDGQDGQRYASVFFWPLVHLNKEAHPSGIVYPSDQITYTITYSNVGARPLQGVIITDTVPVNAQLVSGSISDGGYSDGSVITWTIGGLSRNATGNASFQVEVVEPSTMGALSSVPTTALTSWPFTQPLVSVAPILHPTRTQTCTSDSLETSEQGCISGSGDPTPDCDADLCLKKNSDQASVVAGQALTYTLLVHNDGPLTAEDVIVTDDLPGGVTLTLATPPPSGTSPLTWYLGSIVSGASQVITLVVQVDPGTSGTLTNTASVDSSTPDPNADNNKDEEQTDVVTRQADLRIEKSDSLSEVVPGETLVYNLRVNNDGPSDARNVVVSDTLPAGVSFRSSVPPLVGGLDPLIWYTDTLTAGQAWTVEVTVKVNLNAVGILTNTVCVKSGDSDPDHSDNCDEDRIRAPVPVVNRAHICEDGLWCKEAMAINPPFSVYLPIVFKTSG